MGPRALASVDDDIAVMLPPHERELNISAISSSNGAALVMSCAVRGSSSMEESYKHH